MLIVKVNEGESIEKALKRFKRKEQQTKLVKELRDRKTYVKPSVAKRMQHQNTTNQVWVR